MSWQKEIVSIVRILINDINQPYSYSDQRLYQTIAVAAKYVQFEVVLDRSYEVNVVKPEITPDPTIYNDSIFVSLVGLKTACILDQSNFRTKASLEGIRAALGPAQLSVAGSLTGWQSIIDHGPCKLYSNLAEHWDVQNATAIAAILSPFVGNRFDPEMLPYTNDRGRNLYS